MPFAQTLRKQLTFARFAVREWWPFWFNILNARGRALLASHPDTLTDLQKQIVNTVRTDGIAFTSLEELFPGGNMLTQLQTYASAREANLQQTSKKEFILNYWEFIPALDFTNPFVEFAARPEIVTIANNYMHMWTRLNYFHLAKTVPVGNTEAKFSQNWHRDPEEKRMLKVFIYLTDVDEDAGPFIYVKKSTYGNKYGHIAPQKPPEGSYPVDGTIESSVDPKDIIVATGKSGSVIFCDTSGLHRGGHAKSKERVMSTTFYTANSWTADNPRYRHTPETRAALALREPAIQYLFEREN